jgi:hypothetical protein
MLLMLISNNISTVPLTVLISFEIEFSLWTLLRLNQQSVAFTLWKMFEPWIVLSRTACSSNKPCQIDRSFTANFRLKSNQDRHGFILLEYCIVINDYEFSLHEPKQAMIAFYWKKANESSPIPFRMRNGIKSSDFLRNFLSHLICTSSKTNELETWVGLSWAL